MTFEEIATYAKARARDQEAHYALSQDRRQQRIEKFREDSLRVMQMDGRTSQADFATVLAYTLFNRVLNLEERLEALEGK